MGTDRDVKQRNCAATMPGVDASLSYLNCGYYKISENYSKTTALPHDYMIFYCRGRMQTNIAQWNGPLTRTTEFQDGQLIAWSKGLIIELLDQVLNTLVLKVLSGLI